MITHERIKEVLEFDPETGLFFWKISTGQRAKIGKQAGNINGDGYLQISIDGKSYLAHRLAWFYIHGTWPTNLIDHINTVRTDNRITNLRDVTKNLNQQNMIKAQKNNKTGYLGVCRIGNRYRSQIWVDGKRRHIGYYCTPEEAHEAYLKEKRISHPGNTL